MWSVDKEKFRYGLEQFVECVLEKQNEFDYRTTEIAFHTGYIYEQQWYKRLIWNRAQADLRLNLWTKDMIGSGHIVDDVSLTMNKRIQGQRNNILSWRNVAFIFGQFHENTKACEQVIYDIFKGEDEKAAFEAATELWGSYPIVSYMFFLKDRTRFMPMRPRYFGERLERLGFETKCTAHCTWENYTEFMEILNWIQEELMLSLDDYAELIDAHSFLMLFGMVEDIEPTQDSKDILDLGSMDSVVVTGSRGNRSKHYYVSRYEHMPRLRENAIRVHGHRCAACGFSFEESYGRVGKNFIEVHHIQPLDSPDQKVEIDPKEDLICLCSNCHRMVHRSKNAVMSVEELRQWIIWGGVLNM